MTEEIKHATELQFLIDLLLNHRLNPTTKKLVADRIGFVETSLRQISVPRGTISPIATHPSLQQAPSTIAAMAKHNIPAEAFTVAPVEQTAPAAAMVASKPASARIIGGEVSTGNGTKGPRKF